MIVIIAVSVGVTVGGNRSNGGSGDGTSSSVNASDGNGNQGSPTPVPNPVPTPVPNPVSTPGPSPNLRTEPKKTPSPSPSDGDEVCNIENLLYFTESKKFEIVEMDGSSVTGNTSCCMEANCTRALVEIYSCVSDDEKGSKYVATCCEGILDEECNGRQYAATIVTSGGEETTIITLVYDQTSGSHTGGTADASILENGNNNYTCDTTSTPKSSLISNCINYVEAIIDPVNPNQGNGFPVENDDQKQQSNDDDDDGPAVDNEMEMDFMGVLRKLRWEDEFDGKELNTDIWVAELGNGCYEGTCGGGIYGQVDNGQCTLGSCGYGNRELQQYTPDNIKLEDGKLIIVADIAPDPATNGGMPVSSGKLHTHGDYLIQYGRVEVSAKLPKGRGAWPSIFMLPEVESYGAWPSSGEIDILESFNNEFADGVAAMSTMHYGYQQYLADTPSGSAGAKGQNGCVLRRDGLETFADGKFHIFAVVWAPRSIKFYVDDILHCHITGWFTSGDLESKTAPFDKPFELILNLAVGGDLPSTLTTGDVPQDAWPMTMEFEYVKVFDLTEEEMSWVPNPDGNVIVPRPDNIESQDTPYVNPPEPSKLFGTTRVNMELYNYGGEGVGFHDNDPLINTGTSRLRPYDGVDIYEGNSFTCSDPNVECWKFIDSSGASVQYSEGEWTAYTLEFIAYYDNLHIVLRHSALTSVPFKIIGYEEGKFPANNKPNCNDPYANGGYEILNTNLDNVQNLRASYVPGVTAIAEEYGIPNFCWQTQVWEYNEMTEVPPPGVSKIFFCSLGNDLSVSYMDFMNFGPLDFPTGPGCSQT